MNKRSIFFPAVLTAYTNALALQIAQETMEDPFDNDQCVINENTGIVPDDLYEDAGIIELTNDFAPFTKSLTVRGINLMANTGVSETFMRNVGNIIEDMFEGAEID